jgi:beta-barrel assembly-enhancing protease
MSIFLYLAAAISADPGFLALQAMDSRVMTIGYRLASRNVAHCPNALPTSGVSFHSLGQYGPEERSRVARTFGQGAGPRVMAVAKNSPAEKAGLLPNDLILAAGDARLGETLTPKPTMDAVLRVRKAFAAGLAQGPLSVRVKRGSAEKELMIPRHPACPSTIELFPSSKREAAADGNMLQISSAMVEQTQSDDELAFILAHEMAHNILQHPARLDRIGRKKANILATEIEADKLAVRLMADAGYDPFAAARFWARYGRGPKHGILSDGTHMRSKDRVELLLTEAGKIEAGKIVRPTAQ